MLAAFLLLAAGWYCLSSWIYLKLSPASLDSFSARANNTQLQCVLLGTLIGLPFAMRAADPALRRLQAHWRISAGFLVLFVAAAVWHYGIVAVALAGVLTAFVASWAEGIAGGRPAPSLGRTVFRGGLILLLIAAAFYLFRASHRYYIVDLYEDGPQLSAVNEFLRGGLPYRDFFVHYGPIRDVLSPWIAFKLWGQTYWAVQEMRAFLSGWGGAIMAVLLLAVLRRAWLALLLAFLFALRLDLFIPDRAWLSLLAVTVFAGAWRAVAGRPRGILMAMAGVFSFLALLNSFEIGITLLAGEALYFLLAFLWDRSGWRAAFRPWLGGFLGTAGLWFGWLSAIGGLSGFSFSMESLVTNRLATWSRALPSHLFRFGVGRLHLLWTQEIYLHAVPAVAAGAIGFVASKSRGRPLSVVGHQAVLLSSIVLVQFTIYLARSDFDHWRNATVFYWPLLAVILEEILRTVRGPADYGFARRWMAIALGSVGILVVSDTLIGSTAPMALADQALALVNPKPKAMTPPIPGFERWGAVPAPPEKLEWAREVARAIQESVETDGFFFDFTLYGGFYFLADRRNATRFGLPNYMHGDAMTRACISELMRRPPGAVLVETEKGRLVYRADLEPIAAHIRAHFKPWRQIRHVAVWIPKDMQL